MVKTSKRFYIGSNKCRSLLEQIFHFFIFVCQLKSRFCTALKTNQNDVVIKSLVSYFLDYHNTVSRIFILLRLLYNLTGRDVKTSFNFAFIHQSLFRSIKDCLVWACAEWAWICSGKKRIAELLFIHNTAISCTVKTKTCCLGLSEGTGLLSTTVEKD